jgi:hypothetical protein
VANSRFKGSRDRQLAIGEVEPWRWHRWHNLKLRFQRQTITVLVDDAAVITAQDGEFDHGLAGLATGGEGDARNTALFDNLFINRVNGGAVPPTVFVQDRSPIYPP